MARLKGANKGILRLSLIKERIVDMIYPKVCPVCFEISDSDKNDTICSRCKSRLSYVKEPRCARCGKSVDDEESEYCYDCAAKKHIYRQGTAVWNYTPEIQQSIYAFKYRNQREFSKVYAKEMAENCGHIIRSWNADVIIPIPLHDKKQRIRGFNQAELVALQLGKLLGISVDTSVLVRIKNTAPQKELDDIERLKNLENAFNLAQSVVKYKKVILVDDIYTTGATIDECAKLLLDAGVSEVFFASLCIGRGF